MFNKVSYILVDRSKSVVQHTAVLNTGFSVSTDLGYAHLMRLVNEVLCPATSQYKTYSEHMLKSSIKDADTMTISIGAV